MHLQCELFITLLPTLVYLSLMMLKVSRQTSRYTSAALFISSCFANRTGPRAPSSKPSTGNQPVASQDPCKLHQLPQKKYVLLSVLWVPLCNLNISATVRLSYTIEWRWVPYEGIYQDYTKLQVQEGPLCPLLRAPYCASPYQATLNPKP